MLLKEKGTTFCKFFEQKTYQVKKNPKFEFLKLLIFENHQT